MEEEKVSITGLLSVLFRNKVTVLITMAACLVLGIVIYITSPREYTSSATVIPASGADNSASQLSSLASLAGINLGTATTNGQISIASFEDILHSTPFLSKIISKEYYFPSVGKKISLKTYLIRYSRLTIFESIGRWPGKLASGLSSPARPPDRPEAMVKDTIGQQLAKADTFFANKVLTLDGATRAAIKQLSDNLDYSMDIRTGLVTLNLSLQDRATVAPILKDIIDEFSNYITDYGKKLTQLSLDALKPQVESAEQNYKKTLQALASFQDRNRNVISNAAGLPAQQLQEQLAMAQAVYTSLQQQQQRLLIQISGSLPNVQVVEPPLAQTSPSRPRFVLTIIISLFLGAFLGCTYVLSKKSVIQIIGSGKKNKKSAENE